MTFEPVAPEGQESEVHIPLEQLAAEVRQVLHGDAGEFLQTLLLVSISRPKMLRLAEEAEVPLDAAGRVIDGICDVASRFATIAENLYPQVITRDTLRTIQDRIDHNVARLQQGHAGSGCR